MRETLWQASVRVAVGAGIALLMFAAEKTLGFPSSARFWVGGGALVLGALFSSSNQSRALHELARTRGITDRDVRQFVADRRAEVSAGASLLIVGFAVVVSTFLF